MKLRLLTATFAVVLAGLVGLTTAPSASAAPIDISGAACTIERGATDLTGTFAGTFEPVRFVYSQGSAFVRGTLEGTCTAVDSAGNIVTQSVDQLVNVPITGAQAEQACQILDLTLGPLNLDLLGLVVDLSQVDLDITAVPGAGNLLGNLLCQVAGLLDGGSGGLLQGIVQLLNRLLGQGLLTF